MSASTIPTTGLGYAQASQVGLTGFHGLTLDNSAIVVKYTYEGDANLDGKVDVADIGILATNWQAILTEWYQANFNYDGATDIGDLGLLSTNWQAGVSSGQL